MIDLMNASGRPVIAVDVPSGVNASTGEIVGVAVKAAATVTFGAPKVGLAIAPGLFHAGIVQIAPIGLRPREHEHALVPASALLEVPRKRTESTKYSAGSVLIVGGSQRSDRRAHARGARRPAALERIRARRGWCSCSRSSSRRFSSRGSPISGRSHQSRRAGDAPPAGDRHGRFARRG